MNDSMDICLIKTNEGTQIKITSIHGMLWMQSHFEEAHWDLISNDKVIISNSDSAELALDAQQAGVNLNQIPMISQKSRNF